MKLTCKARTVLRRTVRNHGNLLDHIESKTAVNSLANEDLIELADRLNIDIYAVIHAEIKDFAELMKMDIVGLSEHAFTGHFDFDLTLSAFGESDALPCRLEYRFTPAWQFFCERDNRLKFRWSSCTFQFLYKPPSDGEEIETWQEDAATGRWAVDNDNHIFSILPGDVLFRIEDQIEEECWERDVQNRADHGLPPGNRDNGQKSIES